MTVLGWIFGSSFASALIPVINIEAILLLAAPTTSVPGVWLALVGAVGQMVGKTLWYAAGQNTTKFAWINKKMERPKAKASLERWHARAEGRPWFTAGLLLFSAAIGLPPYAVIAVLAGLIRVPFVVFLASGLLGRFLRFWAVVAATDTIWPYLH